MSLQRYVQLLRASGQIERYRLRPRWRFLPMLYKRAGLSRGQVGDDFAAVFVGACIAIAAATWLIWR
jgi:hypothetical protein